MHAGCCCWQGHVHRDHGSSSNCHQHRNCDQATHYRVSGGPMMVTAHSNMFESSTSPAEKPSTGFLVSSASTAQEVRRQYIRGSHTHWQQLAVRKLHDHLLTASSASLWHSPSCCCYCTGLASTQQRVAHPATTRPHNQPLKRAWNANHNNRLLDSSCASLWKQAVS